MATRSTIALEFADGTVGQVYCHWDGYLDHNGKILQESYSNPFILRDLIDLGDLSSLAPMIGTKHDFDTRVEGVCTFYGRDRGEDNVNARYYKDFADYHANAQFEEYNYILRNDGKWYVEFTGEFKELGVAMWEEVTV
jgi:hypothetical protein